MTQSQISIIGMLNSINCWNLATVVIGVVRRLLAIAITTSKVTRCVKVALMSAESFIEK
jgi:hypothetical protein